MEDPRETVICWCAGIVLVVVILTVILQHLGR